MEVKFFRMQNGRSPVEDFILDRLQPKDKKKAISEIERVQKQPDGLDSFFKAEHAKKLEQDIYELRPGRLRILFTLRDKICWLLHIFFKKSRKTPMKELNLARQRKNLIFN